MSSSSSSVQDLLPDGFRVLKSRTIQSLWAGYGRALEVRATQDDGDGKKKKREEISLVIKHVTPPKGSTRDTDVGNQRKLKSYQVEVAFYRDIAPRLLDQGFPAVAKPISIQSDPSNGSATLVLTDLRENFPSSMANGVTIPGVRSSSQGTLDLVHTKAALTWLAQLHAAFFDHQPLPSADLLWTEGCFWHLETRLDELDDVKRTWPELGQAASRIDQLLRHGHDDDEDDARRWPRTLVHGDAKSANFLFGPPDDGAADSIIPTCAAYDFQYTGGGDGMKDVAYLLCSSTQRQVIQQSEGELLRHYHQTLLSHLKLQQGGELEELEKKYPFTLMMERFELALLDYVRWMAGWGMWGNAEWAKKKAKLTLTKIMSSSS